MGDPVRWDDPEVFVAERVHERLNALADEVVNRYARLQHLDHPVTDAEVTRRRDALHVAWARYRAWLHQLPAVGLDEKMVGLARIRRPPRKVLDFCVEQFGLEPWNPEPEDHQDA